MNFKKIGVYSILIMFALSLLASIVLAQAETKTTTTVTQTVEVTETVKKGVNLIFDPIRDMFAQWEKGDLSKNIAKYLFFALLTLLIYTITTVLPFLENRTRWIQVPFALIISFLATAYITPEEVYMILVSYGAMGLVLGGIIPFIILVFFSIRMSQTAGSSGIIIQKVIWISFIGFIGYKLYSGITNQLFGWVELGVYAGIIVLSLIFIFFNRGLLRLMFNEELKQVREDNLRDVKLSIAAEIAHRERRSLELSAGARPLYDRKTEDMKKHLRELGA